MTTDLDIEVAGVRKIFGQDVTALDGIDLEVERGSFFSLLGPSGCGKSTLLRLLSGLDYPTEGEVKIRGARVQDTAGHRRATNLVFQRLALFPQMTVAKNIAFGPQVHGKKRGEIKRLVAEKLELVEMTALADRYPHQISGGQQQRVAIARALANEPAVLLLDEPLSSLDQKLRVQMQRSLKKIQKNSGTTFVYVTHDQLEAFTMSDRIAVMNNGRIEQIGSPAQVYGSPESEFVATFVGDTNVMRGALTDGRLTADELTMDLDAPGSVVAIRPEAVELAEHLGDVVPNRFPGRVTDVSFGGARIRYEIRAGAGRTIVAERPASDPFRPSPGQDVEFGWSRTAAVVLDD